MDAQHEPGPRARARTETIERIKRIALTQLGEVGAAGLSLRAVARELGVVSSAIYRYCPSRDALLTMLIVDAYTDLGRAAQNADAATPSDQYRARLRAVVLAIREWALAQPARFTLIYGSPVPGYHAPQDTVGPASLVGMVLLGILQDAGEAGAIAEDALLSAAENSKGPEGARTAQMVAPLAQALNARVPASALLIGIDTWVHVFGAVSFEVGGQFVNVLADRGAYYEFLARELSDRLGITR